ncbi:MAG: hypothetical protein ACFFEO_15390 [Candidatus Thorarchaeota archaeon]
MSVDNFYLYKDVKLGFGNFNLPPVLIGTMFYQGQSIVERNNTKNFNKEKAKKRIQNQQDLSTQYKIPSMIEISADNPDAMIKYLEFYLDNFEPPFVLGGSFEARASGTAYLIERGVKPEEFIYNTISNLKNEKECELIKLYKIESIVLLILGAKNMTSSQRFNYIVEKNQPNNISLLDGLKGLGVKRIWIDGGVIDLESLAHILETQQLISTSLKLPTGTAPNLFLFYYSSPKLNLKFHTRYRRASIMFIASWFSNFIFYGAIEDAKECFASTYQAIEFRNIIKSRNIKLLDEF